jgi:hypothetical protein
MEILKTAVLPTNTVIAKNWNEVVKIIGKSK